ncbi:MAG: hypothetical protein K2G38_01930 [Clostridia bacterium]|nr:hypothetical protein [Clostridia bacterium]
MRLKKNKNKEPTLEEIRKKYQIKEDMTDLERNAFTAESLLTDVQLAMKVFFVAEVTRRKDCIDMLFLNGKKFRLYMEEIK